MKEAKEIFKQYNIKASRIACQLLIKQNESIHFTNITCQTDIMKESKCRERILLYKQKLFF